MMVTTEKEFEAALVTFGKVKEAAVDTETMGLQPYHGHRVVGISIYNPEVGSYYFPFRHTAGVNLPMSLLPKLIALIQRLQCIFFNGKFDVQFLAMDGYVIPKTIEDPMLAAHLMNENEYVFTAEKKVKFGPGGKPMTTYKLEDLGAKYLGQEAVSEKTSMDILLKQNKMGKGDMWRLPSDVVAPYAEGDVVVTWKLRDFYARHLKVWKLYDIWHEVCTYSMCIARMEARGLQLNVPLIHEYMKQAEEMTVAAKKQVVAEAGYEINLKSSKQVQALFKVPSADKEVLGRLAEQGDTRAKAILTYRGWEKVNSTYYKPYLEIMDETEVLHANLNLIGTVTGRLSSYKPNMQAVPRETDTYKVKDVFSARPGYTMVSADYSQAEIRLATHYGQDEEMKRILLAGLDMHTTVANDMRISRDDAKRLNFSVIYGIGAKSLAENIGCSLVKAQDYLNRYHAKFPGFRRLYRWANDTAEMRNYIRMFTGRIRRYDHLNPTHKASSNIVQGGVAEMMRVSTLRLAEEFEGKDVHMLLQVHDQILFEIPTGSENTVIPRIKELMERFEFFVPMLVDVKYGPSWGMMQKWGAEKPKLEIVK